MFSDATITTQVLNWVNGLTLPALIGAAWTASRWFSKRENAAKAALEQVENIRTNHLPHLQLSLDEIKESQRDATEAVVAAINASKDAIVQAVISR